MNARCPLLVLLPALFVPIMSAGEPPTLASLGVDPSGLPVAVEDPPEVRGPIFRDGRVLISGQPSGQAFERFKALGVTAVVNLRTPQEMEDRERIPFDEAEAVGALGLEYVTIPLGGDDHPYTPEAVERFADVLSRHQGKVLVHCTVGWRASYMWTAYLIRYQGMDLGPALARGEAVAISPPPLAGLLDRKLTLQWADR